MNLVHDPWVTELLTSDLKLKLLVLEEHLRLSALARRVVSHSTVCALHLGYGGSREEEPDGFWGKNLQHVRASSEVPFPVSLLQGT